MKYINIIKLLSVLLCIGMLFVACDNGGQDGEDASQNESVSETVTSEEETTETPTEEPLLENVESKFENFFEILADKADELGTAVRVDGEIMDMNDFGVYVLKSVDVDTANNVTETFDVYNAKSGKIVFTEQNTYFNGEYTDFDWRNLFVKGDEQTVLPGGSILMESDVKYPSSVLEVSIYDGVIPCIVSRRADITPIDEETRLDNPEGCVYEVKLTYRYYDIYGKLITESSRQLSQDVYNVTAGERLAAVSFGTTMAYFDLETYAVVKTSTPDSEHISGVYSYETDKYGYYTYGYSDDVAGLGSHRYMDIVDKTTGETTRYYVDENYKDVSYFYLHNGDILFRYSNEVEEGEPYDYSYTVLKVVDEGEPYDYQEINGSIEVSALDHYDYSEFAEVEVAEGEPYDRREVSGYVEVSALDYYDYYDATEDKYYAYTYTYYANVEKYYAYTYTYYEYVDIYNTLTYVLLSVDDMTETEVELPYYIAYMFNGEDFGEYNGFDANNVSISTNARNVAYVYAIEDKIRAADQDLVVFDNDMSVLYTFEKLIPEHEVSINTALGFKILENGDYLVALSDNIAGVDKAIVKPDGTVRAYIQSTMTVAGGFVIDGNGKVYDYDLNEVYDLSANGYVKYEETIFGKLILKADDSRATYDPSLANTYWKLEIGSDGKAYTSVIYRDVVIDKVDENYIILKDLKGDGKYTLYTEDMTAVLKSTQEIIVHAVDGEYWAITHIAKADGETVMVLYAISVADNGI